MVRCMLLLAQLVMVSLLPLPSLTLLSRSHRRFQFTFLACLARSTSEDIECLDDSGRGHVDVNATDLPLSRDVYLTSHHSVLVGGMLPTFVLRKPVSLR